MSALAGTPGAGVSPAKRTTSFAAVGVAVMALGYAVLYIAVEWLGWSAHFAYFVQALVSVELNFVLNRRLTWGDRRGLSGTRRQWLRFHASRVVTIPANQSLFSVLTVMGAGYLLANTVCLSLTLAVNYAVSHFWVFTNENR